MSKSKREELGQIVIRPPEGMRDRIKAAAEANNRSMNQEIIARLESTFRTGQQFFSSDEEMADVVEAHKVLSERARLDKLERDVEELKKQVTAKE